MNIIDIVTKAEYCAIIRDKMTDDIAYPGCDVQ